MLVSDSILCHGCLRKRLIPFFKSDQLKQSKPICKQCSVGDDVNLNKECYGDKKFGLRIPVKIRKCLKCDQEFVSRNDFRLCENCKSSHRNESHRLPRKNRRKSFES